MSMTNDSETASETPNPVDAGGKPEAQESAAPLTAEQIQELRQQAGKAEENWQKLLRTTADFDNYKKRITREKQESVRYANENLLTKLIPLLDNFEMAIAAAQGNSAEAVQSLQAGVAMILQQLKSTLIESGLEEIDAAGGTFDPNWHEAVAQRETSEVPEGQVVQQLRKGYKLRDRLLRPATVVVAKTPAS
jgi:molecular chaperone GrpE